MKSGKRAIVIAACLFAAATIGHPSRADDTMHEPSRKADPSLSLKARSAFSPM